MTARALQFCKSKDEARTPSNFEDVNLFPHRQAHLRAKESFTDGKDTTRDCISIGTE